MSVSQLQQLENLWETKMNKGDSLFQSCAYAKAYKHYMEAMIVSELLLKDVASASKAILNIPAMYFTACIKIARGYWEMQDIKNASAYFLYCTYKLKQLTYKPGIDAMLREAASVYWLKAVQLYTEFSEKSGMPLPAHLEKEETYLQLKKLKMLFNISKENLN